jgi:putative ABC transport system permease protein
MAIKSILSNKARTVLTMLGIIIGIAAVMTIVAVVQGSNKQMMEYYESQGTNKIDVYAYQWNGKDVSQKLYDYCLSLNKLVDGVTPNLNYWGSNGSLKYKAVDCANNPDFGAPQIMLGSDQYSLCNNFTIAEGRDLSYLDIKTYNQVVVLGAEVKNYLFQYQNPIGQRVTLGTNSFEVIGVYKAKDTGFSQSWGWSMDNMAVVPYTLNRMLNSGNSRIESFVVKAKDKSSTTEAITRLTGFLSGEIDSNMGYFSVYSQNEWMESSNDQTKMMSYVGGGVAGISLLVGGIGIMNIMLVTVRERTREIGIRRAIGGSRRTILTQFLLEAAVVCGVGGLFGLVLGTVGTLVAGKLMLKTILTPSVTMSFAAFAFSVALGLLFGIYPAIKAAWLQPVEALRAE